jgi:formate C-acetyltransferase
MFSRTEDVVGKSIPLSERVQKGHGVIQDGRFRKKLLWDARLTVLNEETATLPLVKRKALAIGKQLAEMPVGIKDYELLAGDMFQSSVSTTAPFPEYATQKEMEAASEKGTSPGSIFGHFCPSYSRYLKHGVGGLRTIAEEKLNEARRNGAGTEKVTWYESVIVALDGYRDFMLRYRDLASGLADAETDPVRKEELKGIALISQHLAQEPPQTFREAVQAFWFAHVTFQCTSSYANVPIGRTDQYLWPYLKADLESDKITIEQAQELVDLLWLRFNERLQALELAKGTHYYSSGLSSSASAVPSEAVAEQLVNGLSSSLIIGARGPCSRGKDSLVAGVFQAGHQYNQWLQTMTLGGLTPQGVDGTNPLTYLCLNASLRLQLSEPDLYIRFHDGSPPELYERVADCMRAGLAPAVYNDEVIVPALERIGLPVEDARDYTSDGCWEIYSQGRTNFKYSVIPANGALDRVFYSLEWDGEAEVPGDTESVNQSRDSKPVDPHSFHSFDEVMESFKEQLDRLVRMFMGRLDNSWDGRLYDIAPLPLLSAMVEGPLESGKDLTQCGAEHNFHAPLLSGLSHVTDSLAVIKKLCFEEKVISWPELLDTIRDNWRDKESLRQLVMTRAPAYGNDIDYVDDIAREIVEYFVESVRKYGARVKNKKLKFPPGLATFEMYVALGVIAGATADGRMDGQPISSNASPSLGRAMNGQTATVDSYRKLPLVDLPCGAPLDIAMEHRASLLRQLEAFIKSFVEERGQLLSISVNNCEQLRAAQREPEKYRDLKIRMGGWQAYFRDLPPVMQDWQIRKCETYAGS